MKKTLITLMMDMMMTELGCQDRIRLHSYLELLVLLKLFTTMSMHNLYVYPVNFCGAFVDGWQQHFSVLHTAYGQILKRIENHLEHSIY